MTGHDPIETLQSIARRRTEGALVELGNAVRASRHSSDQLRVLQQYRAEYTNRLSNAAQAGVPASVLANYRSFLDRLDVVIDQARHDADLRAVVVQAGQEKWRDAAREQKSYEVIAERRATSEERRENRRAQKQSDEIAARLATARLQSA